MSKAIEISLGSRLGVHSRRQICFWAIFSPTCQGGFIVFITRYCNCRYTRRPLSSLDSHASSLLFPLYQTGTFVHDAVGVDKGFSYSRVSNPTVDALERAIGSLEGTAPAVCFRTGMAAESALFFSVLRAGEHAILSEVTYGGTIRLFREILEPLGVHASFVDTSNPANVEAAITPQTRIVFIETPANPVLKLTDIAAIAEITKRHSLLLAVDNTFLTPVLQRPLELGADISVLSTTKYIDGHNATVGGSLATNDVVLAERFRLIRKTLGSIQAPFEAWLTLQGIKTLPARLRLHCENAQIVAEWIEAHPAVAQVYYPGLPSFPQHELALRQQRAPCGMISQSSMRHPPPRRRPILCAALLTRRKPWRIGDSDHASGLHHSRRSFSGIAPTPGHLRRTHTALGWIGISRRHHRRSRTGIRGRWLL